MDTVQKKDGSMVALVPQNRGSQRSVRRGKNKFTPTIVVQNMTENGTRAIASGLNDAFVQIIRESPTLYSFLSDENSQKNRYPELIILYDFSRVILTEPGDTDYYHASYVDGASVVKQYVLGQAPFNSVTEADFHRLISQLKPEVVVVLMKEDTPEAKLMFPFTKGESKTQAGITLKIEEDSNTPKFRSFQLSVSGGKSGNSKTNVCFLSSWVDDNKVPADMNEFLDLVQKKGCTQREASQLVMCTSGALRAGVWMMFDSECERMRTKGRIRFSESLRQLRYQRNGAVDSVEMFTGLVEALEKAAKTYA